MCFAVPAIPSVGVCTHKDIAQPIAIEVAGVYGPAVVRSGLVGLRDPDRIGVDAAW